MQPIQKLWCRTFQLGFRVALPFLPYREPQLLSACQDLVTVFPKTGTKSALVVTDSGIVKTGLTEPLVQVLTESGIQYTIYDQTKPNPTVDNVEEALALYKCQNCDTIIAIGGGSSMDCAKAVGARVVYPKRGLDKLKGKLRVWRKLPTLIAIPTTAGTGSEVTLASLITDSTTHTKYAIMSFPLIPHYAVLDATLTYSLPPHLTAATGIDALTHAVEAYIGQTTTKETRQLSLDATKLVFAHVENAYKNGHDHQARENMLHAAYKAGHAFSKSYVGYIHAIAHSLGGFYGTPHGLANAVVLPYVLEGYGACVHRQLQELGIAAGVCTTDDTAKEGAEKFIAAIRQLNRRMGIPEKLSDIRKEDIPALARHAAKEANPLYPVPQLWDADTLAEYYQIVGENV